MLLQHKRALRKQIQACDIERFDYETLYPTILNIRENEVEGFAFFNFKLFMTQYTLTMCFRMPANGILYSNKHIE